jgi:signal transduction histidine kinase
VKPRVQLFVSLITGLAVVLVVTAFVHHDRWQPELMLLWIMLCMVSEHFWMKTPSGDSVQSLAATAKLSAVLLLDAWGALIVIFLSTVVGNFLFRRSRWYRAVYNGSQLTLAGGGAALAYYSLGGPYLSEAFARSSSSQAQAVIGTLARQEFLLAFLVAGLTYFVINNACMNFLLSAMSGRPIRTLWRENFFYPELIQSNLTLVLLTPLLVLLYGVLDLIGLVLLFACLALVHQANRRYLAVIQAQDDLIRSERMTAMGEMAEEIGQSLGRFLEELKATANRLYKAMRRHGDERMFKNARIIEVNVENMSALVDGLAAFSHQEKQVAATDLNELLRRTIEFVRPQNRFDHIHFKFTPDPILPTVNVDPAQLQQVFINLLANAADALAEVDREVRKIFVETRYDPNDQRIRIAVADNGPGIPEAILSRIFEPHFTTKVSGHGFGLATVFRIASNHKGTISASNLPGFGAQFVLDLPNA